jgi:cytochrome P450
MSDPINFNPLDPGVRRDPFAAYARARREVPALVHAGLPIRLVSVFRYEDCQAVLRDAQTWSSEFPVIDQAEGQNVPARRSMLGSDPPAHTRLRSLVNKAFTPRMIQRLEPRMHEIANELLDAALEQGDVDLVQTLTYPLPVTIIAEIIGIPAEDRAQFKRWSDAVVANLGLVFLGGFDPERAQRQQKLFDAMREYFIPLAEERKRSPREDLLTGLVQAEHEGSKLDFEEMLSMLVLLLVAGNETTTTLIGNAALELLAHPGELERLRDDPGLLPSAIEEVLRFASPVQFDPRRATRALSLHGVEIRENDVVLSWLGSANRDERSFERPESFDIGREKNPHLAFGFGTHYCIGANLARLEARVALGALLARTRSFERRGDELLPLHPSPVFRAVTQLPLRLVAA